MTYNRNKKTIVLKFSNNSKDIKTKNTVINKNTIESVVYVQVGADDVVVITERNIRG